MQALLLNISCFIENVFGICYKYEYSFDTGSKQLPTDILQKGHVWTPQT